MVVMCGGVCHARFSVLFESSLREAGVGCVRLSHVVDGLNGFVMRVCVMSSFVGSFVVLRVDCSCALQRTLFSPSFSPLR